MVSVIEAKVDSFLSSSSVARVLPSRVWRNGCQATSVRTCSHKRAELSGIVCIQDVRLKKDKSGLRIIGFGTSRAPSRSTCQMLMQMMSTAEAWWQNPMSYPVVIWFCSNFLRLTWAWTATTCRRDVSGKRVGRRGKQCHGHLHQPAVLSYVLVRVSARHLESAENCLQDIAQRGSQNSSLRLHWDGDRTLPR